MWLLIPEVSKVRYLRCRLRYEQVAWAICWACKRTQTPWSVLQLSCTSAASCISMTCKLWFLCE